MSWSRKPKEDKEDKVLYTIYHPHSKEESERKWGEDYYQVCAVDPGTKNFAMRVERRYHRGEKKGVIIPLLFCNVDISGAVRKKKGESKSANSGAVTNGEKKTPFDILGHFLDSHLQTFLACHLFVVEKQMVVNIKATAIATYTISYFHIKMKDTTLLPIIVRLDAKVKSQQLGGALAYKSMGAKGMKEWAKVTATQLLTTRKDMGSLEILTARRKQDDLADTVVMIEALFSLWNWSPLTSEVKQSSDVPQKRPVLRISATERSVADLVFDGTTGAAVGALGAKAIKSDPKLGTLVGVCFGSDINRSLESRPQTIKPRLTIRSGDN